MGATLEDFMRNQSSLEAMRRALVLTDEESADARSTPLEKLYCQMKDDDLRGFLATLRALEAEEKAEKKLKVWDGKGKCPTCARVADVMDSGTELALQELRRFLKETEYADKR